MTLLCEEKIVVMKPKEARSGTGRKLAGHPEEDHGSSRAVLPTVMTTKTSKNKQTKQTPWSESANELYRPSDRRLSAKLLPTFADKGAAWSA
jgi:hypothetical protein